MSKVAEIIAAATEDAVSVPSLLRNLTVVAARLDTAVLLEWVDNELAGYADSTFVPSYRGPFPTEVVGQWAGPGGSHSTVPLPSATLPEEMRKAPYELVFRNSVSELDVLARSRDLLKHDWPSNAVATVNRMIAAGQIQPDIPMGSLVNAYRRFSPALVVAILDAVRTRVLNLALDLEKLSPRAGEPDAPPIDAATVLTVVTTNIWGDGEPGCDR